MSGLRPNPVGFVSQNTGGPVQCLTPSELRVHPVGFVSQNTGGISIQTGFESEDLRLGLDVILLRIPSACRRRSRGDRHARRVWRPLPRCAVEQRLRHTIRRYLLTVTSPGNYYAHAIGNSRTIVMTVR